MALFGKDILSCPGFIVSRINPLHSDDCPVIFEAKDLRWTKLFEAFVSVPLHIDSISHLK